MCAKVFALPSSLFRGAPRVVFLRGDQAFFTQLIERRLLDQVEEGRGRFRGFLLAALEHFLANEYRSARAEKRGGGAIPLRLEFGDAESQYSPASGETAEDLYTRSWATSVLEEALQGLQKEWGERFAVICAHLGVHGNRPTYHETAVQLGISEADVGNLLHKARIRLGQLIIQGVRDTVEGDPGEEVKELMQSLARKTK